MNLPTHDQVTGWLLVADQVANSVMRVLSVAAHELEEIRATLPAESQPDPQLAGRDARGVCRSCEADRSMDHFEGCPHEVCGL